MDGDYEEPKTISPPSGAESLFLAGLDAVGISPAAISKQLQLERKSPKNRLSSYSKINGSTIDEDEFLSCTESASDYETDNNSFDSTNENLQSLNPQYSPIINNSPHSMETIIDNNKKSKDTKNTTNRNIMQALSRTKTLEATPKKEFPVKHAFYEPETTETSEPIKIDAAEVVYGKAKDIFAWGKTVPVVSFFLGTGEAVAGKALSVVGTDLPSLDGIIGSELTKLDGCIINPAVDTIAKVLLNVAGKSEEFVKPIIIALLSPFGMIKSEANESNPETHLEQ